MDALLMWIQWFCWLGLAVGAWFSITYHHLGDEQAARRHIRAWGDEPCYPARDARHEQADWSAIRV
jgi:hypothetical protein